MGIREELVDDHGDDLLFADGFDSAIIGVCHGHDCGRVAYDVRKMIVICMREGRMSHEQAVEYLTYNTFGAYVGKRTPIYVEADKWTH